MIDILVLFHSVTGTTFRIAEAIAQGIEQVDSCRSVLRRVPEIPGSESIFAGVDMASPQPAFASAEIAEVEDLARYDAIAVGSPVYFGSQSSSLRFFFDHAGRYWMDGTLTGKPATAFAGAGSGAGREAVLLSLWSTFAVFGLTIVPLGTRAQQTAALGATPFGVAAATSSLAENDFESARIQGRALAEVTASLKTA